MIKYILKVLPFWTVMCVLAACSSSEDNHGEKDPDILPKAETTVIIYMAAENNLSGTASDNLSTIANASKTGNLSNNYLVAFVDKKSALPYVASFKDGKETRDSHYTCNEDFISADPEKMYETLAWIQTRYPANNYALILWGHCSGWLTENDTIATSQQKSTLQQAYGIDYGTDNAAPKSIWINIPTLANTLNRLKKFKYIIADCCNFQCVEVAYELRHCCEYTIGSPAEMPSKGVPYAKLVPLLFDTTEQNMQAIADGIFNQTIEGKHIPVSVIKTSELPALANKTQELVNMLYEENKEPSVSKVIHYFSDGTAKGRTMYDMKDMFYTNLYTDAATAYQQWLQAYDNTVIYQKIDYDNPEWITDPWGPNINFYVMNIQPEKFGGCSMFFPLKRYDSASSSYARNYNRNILKLQWPHAIGLEKYCTPQ